MKALVYGGPGHRTWERGPRRPASGAGRRDHPGRRGHHLRHRSAHPRRRRARGDAGTDPRSRGRRHGRGDRRRRAARVGAGDRVLVSCISGCGRCRFCREGRYGQCLGGGGWVLGHMIDGVQAEYGPRAVRRHVRAPAAARVSDEAPCCSPTSCRRPTRSASSTGRWGRATRRHRRRRADRARRDHDRAAVRPRHDRRRRPGRRRLRGRQAARRGHRPRRRTSDVAGRGPGGSPAGSGADVVIEAVGIPATFELRGR